MKKEHWHSLDFLRVCSFLLIFIYHYIIELKAAGFYDFSSMGIFYENNNLNMARIGVILFFMLSGFGLMKSSMRKGIDEFSFKDYAFKRFVKILIPYYVISILVFAGKMILDSGMTFAEKKIPVWSILLTVLGLDGYLAEYGIQTYHLGVGEWFVGCLILIYLVFPLIRKSMDRYPEWTLGIATIIYISIVLLYKGTVPSYYFYPVKLYDFMLGMFLAKKLEVPSKKWSMVCGAGAVVVILLPWNLPIDENFLNVVFALLAFLAVFHLEGYVRGSQILGMKGISIIAGCSYEMFLVHHWGIIFMSRLVKPTTLPTAVIYLAAELAAVMVLGFVLHYLINRLFSSVIRIT